MIPFLDNGDTEDLINSNITLHKFMHDAKIGHQFSVYL